MKIQICFSLCFSSSIYDLPVIAICVGWYVLGGWLLKQSSWKCGNKNSRLSNELSVSLSGTTAYLEQSIPYPRDGKQVFLVPLNRKYVFSLLVLILFNLLFLSYSLLLSVVQSLAVWYGVLWQNMVPKNPLILYFDLERPANSNLPPTGGRQVGEERDSLLSNTAILYIIIPVSYLWNNIVSNWIWTRRLFSH